MSKIRYALCALGWFLTKMQKGVINAFLRRMCKYNFVSEYFDIDSVMGDMHKNFLRRCFPSPLSASASSSPSCQKQSIRAPRQGP